jgi:hypothetical protein
LGGYKFVVSPGKKKKAQAIAGHGATYLSSQAMQEAKIGRVAAPGKPRQKKYGETPYQ